MACLKRVYIFSCLFDIYAALTVPCPDFCTISVAPARTSKAIALPASTTYVFMSYRHELLVCTLMIIKKGQLAAFQLVGAYGQPRELQHR